MMISGRLDRDTAHYRIAPLTTYVDAAEMETLFQRAAAGERVTYAIGPAVSLTATTAALVRRWHDKGLCDLHRERETAGRGFRYFIQKRHVAAVEPKSDSPAGSIDGRPEARLLRVLTGVAETGGPMPSLDLLAERAQLPHRQAADYRLRLLVEGGFITIRRKGINRFVEILKTGDAL